MGGGGGGGKGDRTEARVHNDFMKLVNDVCHIEPIMDSFDRYGGHEWHFVCSKETNGTNVQFKKHIDGKIYCKA